MRIVVSFAALLALGCAPASFAHTSPEHKSSSVAPWQQASTYPERIVATFSGDPATTVSVNWRTGTSVTATRAEIAKALPDARFDQLAKSVTAQSEVIDLATIRRAGVDIPIAHNQGLTGAAYHSVQFEGLDGTVLIQRFVFLIKKIPALFILLCSLNC